MAHHPVFPVIGLMCGTCNCLSTAPCGILLAIPSRSIGEALCKAAANRQSTSCLGFHLSSTLVLWPCFPRKLKGFIGFALTARKVLIGSLSRNPAWSRQLSINTTQWFDSICLPVVENASCPSSCHDIILGVRVAGAHIEVMGYYGGLDWLRVGLLLNP